jgi:hypothetical protein
VHFSGYAIVCHSYFELQCLQTLLGSVVQVALEAAAGVVGCGHDPRP